MDIEQTIEEGAELATVPENLPLYVAIIGMKMRGGCATCFFNV